MFVYLSALYESEHCRHHCTQDENEGLIWLDEGTGENHNFHLFPSILTLTLTLVRVLGVSHIFICVAALSRFFTSQPSPHFSGSVLLSHFFSLLLSFFENQHQWHQVMLRVHCFLPYYFDCKTTPLFQTTTDT